MFRAKLIFHQSQNMDDASIRSIINVLVSVKYKFDPEHVFTVLGESLYYILDHVDKYMPLTLSRLLKVQASLIVKGNCVSIQVSIEKYLYTILCS